MRGLFRGGMQRLQTGAEKKRKIIIFCENLTLRSFFSSLLPFLLQRRCIKKETVCVLLFNCSRAMLEVARYLKNLIGMECSLIKYSIEDIRDENGYSVRLKVAYQELAKFQMKIEDGPTFRALTDCLKSEGRLIRFLSKCLCKYDPSGIDGHKYIWNALLLINIFACIARKNHERNHGIFVFLEKRIWWKSLQDYGARIGVTIKALPRQLKFEYKLKRSDRFFLRQTIDAVIRKRVFHSNQASANSGKNPCVATEYYGHLNLNRPELYSDVFFLNNSELQGSDTKLFFRDRSISLDRDMYNELRSHGITPIVLDPRASKVPEAYIHNFKIKSTHRKITARGPAAEAKWLQREATEFDWLKSYWHDIFVQHGVKVYFHWYKYDAEHMAIADAMKDLGGIMALYQRSFEVQPTAETTLSLDIEFGFSPNEAELERKNKSHISYHVTTGYPGDFRFPLLRNEAIRIREDLRRNGAKHILAYFDENTIDDPRWFASHEFTKKNYAYILNKVLANPWLGLVVKPKSPSNLRQRLGLVCDLLDAALVSNRCYLLSGGVLQGSYPPSVAALAADLAIHDSLAAATAGLESALCGTPTLLMDFEGWPGNKLYRLGLGRVVFTDWDSAWEACCEHFGAKHQKNKYGDWSPMLNELDPFRDGRAAERIGTYLKWLLDGFKAGFDRETVMADAAERYCRLWGYDKITSVNIYNYRKAS